MVTVAFLMTSTWAVCSWTNTGESLWPFHLRSQIGHQRSNSNAGRSRARWNRHLSVRSAQIVMSSVSSFSARVAGRYWSIPVPGRGRNGAGGSAAALMDARRRSGSRDHRIWHRCRSWGEGQGRALSRTDLSDSGLAGTELALDIILSINTIVDCFGSSPLPARSFSRLCLSKPKPPA